jgi:hypothetical protein
VYLKIGYNQNFKGEREDTQSNKRKETIHKGVPICLTVNLSVETFRARRKWHEIFTILKEEKPC